MGITYVDTILDGLVEEMSETIKATGVYETSPTVDRGVKSWDETSGRRPFVWFVPTDVLIEELMGNTANVVIEVELQGYADADGYGNNDRMYKLYKDVQYFLWNDYSEQVVITRAPPGEGSLYGDGMSGFLISFNIFVNIDTTTINVVE